MRLYYYNARYYDATIGRFISADIVIQNQANPQCFNRYSYVLNNPLRYIDPSGKFSVREIEGMGVSKDNVKKVIYEMLRNASVNDKLVVKYTDGSQLWVVVRNGLIRDGGINLEPRFFPPFLP